MKQSNQPPAAAPKKKSIAVGRPQRHKRILALKIGIPESAIKRLSTAEVEQYARMDPETRAWMISQFTQRPPKKPPQRARYNTADVVGAATHRSGLATKIVVNRLNEERERRHG